MRVLALLLLTGAIAIGVLSSTDIETLSIDKNISKSEIEKTEKKDSSPKLAFERKW